MAQLAKTREPRNGFTKVPNAVIDNPNLSARDKLVLIKVMSHAYGDKTEASPSQKGTADSLGYRRETVKAAYESLVASKVLLPHGKGRSGRQETFTVDLSKAANLTTQSAGTATVKPSGDLTSRSAGDLTTQSAGDLTSESSQIRSRIRQQRRQQEDGSAAPEGSSLSDDEERLDSDVGLVDSAACSEASHSLDNGNPEPKARLHASRGPQYIAPRPFTKAEINAALLTPDGQRVNCDVDDLHYDLQNIFLPEVRGEYLRDDDFDRLVELRGVKFCRFWSYWLPRKIAWYYDVKKEPVPKPTALYIRAIEGEWEVDPKWPMFDEDKHTWAAQAQADLRTQRRAEPKPTTQYNDEPDESPSVELEDEFEECFR